MAAGFRSRLKANVTRATRAVNNVRRHVGAGIDALVDVEELEDSLGQVERILAITEPLLQKPRSPVALARAIVGLGKFCIENPEIGDPEDYFNYEGRGWEQAFNGELTQIIFDSVRPRGELVRASGGKQAGPTKQDAAIAASQGLAPGGLVQGAYVGKIAELPDIQVGWMVGAFDRVERIFLMGTDMPAVQENILQVASNAFWARRKTRHQVLRLSKNRYNDTKPGLVDDDTRHVHQSKLSNSLVENTRQYMDAGVSWTYMLYGPPGSGKSTAAQRLIMDLNIRSLRLPVETIHMLEADDLDMIFKVVRPEAVVMDDFDRCHHQEILLERLEKLRREVKLVVATVNNPDELDEAVLRPGRVDEWVEVDRLDVDAIRNILGDYADDSLDLVKEWPVAFIENYITRRRVLKMSAIEARDSMVELAARVKRMRQKQIRALDPDEELSILTDAPSPITPGKLVKSRRRRKVQKLGLPG